MKDESIFDRRASDELRALELVLGDLDGVEADFTGDVLTLEFDDDSVFVINSHRAAREIWMSANRSAWHFGYAETDDVWRENKEGHELRPLLARLVGEKTGQKIEF